MLARIASSPPCSIEKVEIGQGLQGLSLLVLALISLQNTWIVTIVQLLFISITPDSLKADRRHSESARVLIDYAEDVEEAVVNLLEGSLWEEALRLIYFHRRTDLLETHLKPGLVEAHASQMSLFEELRSTYVRHASRLAVVRETKRQKQNAILGE